MKRSPVGPEIPNGKYMVISALAQMPGTHSTLLATLRGVIRDLEPGTILVAAADTPLLASRYERLGFTQGTQERVYRGV